MRTHTRVLGTPPWVQNKFAYQLLAGARFFRDDADTFGTRGTAGQFFLYFQSIELALKSYLALKGMNEKQLQKLRHDLEKILAKGGEMGLEKLPDELLPVLAAMNKGNENAAMRYVFEFELPGIELTRGLADAVLKMCGQHQRSPAGTAEDEQERLAKKPAS
jgi:hypothetical protein